MVPNEALSITTNAGAVPAGWDAANVYVGIGGMGGGGTTISCLAIVWQGRLY